MIKARTDDRRMQRSMIFRITEIQKILCIVTQRLGCKVQRQSTRTEDLCRLTRDAQMIEHSIATVQCRDMQRIITDGTPLAQSSIVIRLLFNSTVIFVRVEIETHQDLRCIDIIDECRVVQRCSFSFAA